MIKYFRFHSILFISPFLSFVMVKIIVGMSGGVDSSVAALLLQRQGYEVIGVFMKNYSRTNPATGECSWLDERRMARRVAAILEIPLLTIDSEAEYCKDVIDEMYKDYSKGLTPNPDILCNKIIKFPFLWKKARELGASYIATGHYARVLKRQGNFNLLMGKDKMKDQSYFLAGLTQKELSHTLFPIGNLTKEEVREIARKAGFPNWNQKGTTGICFVGKIDMKEFLRRGIKEKKGDVICGGEIVGEHPGIMFFTIGERIGERKGIKLEVKFKAKFSNDKFYVTSKLGGNKLVIAREGDASLKTSEIKIKKLKWINDLEINGLKARIRHLGKLYSGRLFESSEFARPQTHGHARYRLTNYSSVTHSPRPLPLRELACGRVSKWQTPGLLNIAHLSVQRRTKSETNWIWRFSKGVEGVAPGQIIVFYKGEKLVGSGEIR